jgi:Flp pilus assembly protein TadD
MQKTLAALFMCLPLASYGAGSDDSTPPTPTETTTECKDGEIWDADTKACIKADDARLGDDARYEAVRELAYSGAYDRARLVLSTMEARDTRTLTYLGFIHRKEGNWDAALASYRDALAVDPGNILARSYMGQGFVINGEYDLAEAQYLEIIDRGGADTWAAEALRKALTSGDVLDY